MYNNLLAGTLEKTDSGYSFTYDQAYLKSDHPKPVSQTLPLSPYTQPVGTCFRFLTDLFPKDGYLI